MGGCVAKSNVCNKIKLWVTLYILEHHSEIPIIGWLNSYKGVITLKEENRK